MKGDRAMTVPAEFLSKMTDLTSHRIEGIARMGDTPFDCPIISQIDGNLWSGGCPPVELPAYFRFVVNLYPWGRYPVAEGTTVLVATLYDSEDVPEPELLVVLADYINAVRKIGPTLVHCQAGLNRSGLLTGLALVRAGMTPDAAITLLRERRSPAVLCNPAFETWLRKQGVKP
jgi:hypothetical protein